MMILSKLSNIDLISSDYLSSKLKLILNFTELIQSF